MRTFDIAKVTELVTQGYLIVQKHPTEDLSIYNYSQKTQYDGGHWNEITLACRGLILDSKGQIHASTFNKFFNYGQKEAVIPENRGFTAYEKMDGSYVGSYWVKGKVYLNTKGSFTFDYVTMATHILNTRYADAKTMMDPRFTYVFELIFPAGRIVLDYGDTQDLVLLAVFEIATGAEIPLSIFNFMGFSRPTEEYFPNGTEADIKALMMRNTANKEGYVLKFHSDPQDLRRYVDLTDLGQNFSARYPLAYTRVKVKFDEYVYLHRIITNVTSYDIYDALRREGGVPESLLELVPDEFYAWVRAYEAKLFQQYRNVADSVFTTYFTVLAYMKPGFTRYELYTQVQLLAPSLLSSVMSIYDMNYERLKDTIWKGLKPPFEKPFQYVEKQLQQVMSAVTAATQENVRTN